MEPTSPRPGRFDGLLVAAIALALNACLLADVARSRPEYLRDYRLNANPDAIHYVLLGHNVFRLGKFSRQEEPPYEPDMIRTPVYPLVSGGLDLLTRGPWSLYVLQALCHAATALGTLCFARELGGRRAGLIAGLLVAADPLLAVTNLEAMSESMYAAVATWGAVLVLRWLRVSGTTAPTPGLGRGALAGAVLALATLVRPAGLYVPLALGAAIVLRSLVRRDAGLVRATSAALAVYVALVGAWIARNAVVCGIPRLTFTDSLNLCYLSGASAYATEHGLTLEQGKAAVAREYGIEPSVVAHNPWRSQRPLADMLRDQRRVGRDLLLRHPKGAAVSSAKGLLKTLVGHNADVLAHATGRTWEGGGLARLARGDVAGFVESVGRNAPVLQAVFVAETLLAPLVLLAAGIGWVRALRSRYEPWVLLGITLLTVYYLLTIALVGMDAFCRLRVGLVPLFALLAAGALVGPGRSDPTTATATLEA